MYIIYRITKFTSVRNITLFFPENFGDDTSIIRFLGFKGDWTEVRKNVFIYGEETGYKKAQYNDSLILLIYQMIRSNVIQLLQVNKN